MIHIFWYLIGVISYLYICYRIEGSVTYKELFNSLYLGLFGFFMTILVLLLILEEKGYIKGIIKFLKNGFKNNSVQ